MAAVLMTVSLPNTALTQTQTSASQAVWGHGRDAAEASGITRCRYKFREGKDLWITWNEGLNLQLDIFGIPPLPSEAARTLALKYSHTFIY